jgi:hypothetical protein
VVVTRGAGEVDRAIVASQRARRADDDGDGVAAVFGAGRLSAFRER